MSRIQNVNFTPKNIYDVYPNTQRKLERFLISMALTKKHMDMT